MSDPQLDLGPLVADQVLRNQRIIMATLIDHTMRMYGVGHSQQVFVADQLNSAILDTDRLIKQLESVYGNARAAALSD